jgi:hypothetical protein
MEINEKCQVIQLDVKDSLMLFHRRGSETSIFEASDQDTSGASYQYFGYLNAEGNWIIQQFDIRVAGIINYRYCSGLDGYATAWANRGGLVYGLYNTLFPDP